MRSRGRSPTRSSTSRAPKTKNALSDAKIKLLGDLYLAKARRNGGQPETLGAIDEHFKRVSVNIRTAERERVAAEPLHRKRSSILPGVPIVAR